MAAAPEFRVTLRKLLAVACRGDSVIAPPPVWMERSVAAERLTDVAVNVTGSALVVTVVNAPELKLMEGALNVCELTL